MIPIITTETKGSLAFRIRRIRGGIIYELLTYSHKGTAPDLSTEKVLLFKLTDYKSLAISKDVKFGYTQFSHFCMSYMIHLLKGQCDSPVLTKLYEEPSVTFNQQLVSETCGQVSQSMNHSARQSIGIEFKT